MTEYLSPWEDEAVAAWRVSVRRFAEQEVAPAEAAWSRQGYADRSIWRRAGELGMLAADLPEGHGGLGASFAYAAVLGEELSRVGANALRVAFTIHVIAAHYVAAYGTEAQKERWLPGMSTGEIVAGMGMSEPGGGSDLQSMRTRADRTDDGFLVNGSKIFITNGSQADLLVLAAKTDPTARGRGISMMLFPTATPGFRVGQRLDKLGIHSSDTCELFFDDCRIPADSLLGERPGQGFIQMMSELAYERLLAGVGCVAGMEYALDLTRRYAAEREAYGAPLLNMQNVRFELAAIATDTMATRTLVDHAVGEMIAGRMTPALASMAKYWASERLGLVVDRCVQIFGGYGYITDYPIARLYADARIERIYGGTTEVMKDIISRSLLPGASFSGR